MDVMGRTSVEPIALLYMFAIFGEFSCVQDLIFVKLCFNYFNPNERQFNESNVCDFNIHNNNTKALTVIESESSEQLLKYNAILAITSIISSFIAGSYGDAYGRAVPLSVAPLFSFVVQIILIIASIYMKSNNILILIMICAFISGISGGSPSLLANCFGFISDISTQNQRTSRLVILEAHIFGGAFFGYISAGLILKNFINYRYIICFSLYLTIHSFILLYIWLRLTKMSINQTQRPLESRFGYKNLFLMFSDVFKTVFKRRQTNNRKLIFLLIVCFVLVTYGTVVLTDLLFLYVRNRPLLWDTSLYAYYSGIKFGATGLALCSLPLVQHYLWPNMCDTSIAMIGVLSRTLGLIVIGVSHNSYLMFSTIILLTFSEYPLPAIRSLLSKLVSIDERGKVFAFLTLFHNLCSLSGGIVFPIIYKSAVNTDGYTGLCFQIIAVLQIMAIIIFVYIRFQLKSTQFVESDHNSDETNILAEDHPGMDGVIN